MPGKERKLIEAVWRAALAAVNPADNDSYHFFEALGDLIITGPTNTNVNDLAFVFVS